MSISITVGGTKTVIEDLKGLTEAGKNEVIAKMSQIAYDSAKQGVARHFKKGNLEKSLLNRAIPGGREVTHDGEYLKRVTDNKVDYAGHVLLGWSRTNPIYPKVREDGTTKKALRWTSGGRYVFAKFVKTPARYAGDNYLYRAADDAIAAFPKLVDEAFRNQ